MNDTKAQLNQAIQAIKKKDYTQARAIVRTVINSDPNVIDAWLLYARIAPNKEQARQCLERALAIDPDHALGQKMMGQLNALGSSPEPSQPGQPVKVPHEHPGQADSSASKANMNASQPPKTLEEQAPPQPAKKTKKANRSSSWVWGLIIVTVICLLVVGGIALTQNFSDLTLFANNAPTPTNEELFNVIYRNMRAANSEDITAYMTTIHTKSPLYRQTEDALRMAFSTYDLSYYASDLIVDKISSREASIHFKLTTKKINGPTFRDNIVEGEFIMRPENDEWKIYNQEIIDVTYLN